MKVIIDTNILIYAVISGKNSELIIKFIIESSQYQWIVTQAILDEYLEVLSRPKCKLNLEKMQKWLNLIKSSTKMIEFNTSYDFPREQKDAKFITCAFSSNADFLITGDKDFEEVNLIGETIIISLSQFKDLVMS